MAWCPFAVHRPLPEQGKQRATEEKRLLVYHSAVDGRADSLFDFFRNSTDLESHFYIKDGGGLEQYLDTDQRADANRMVNDEAISVETGDQGDPDRQPWTPAQMEMGARLGRWCADVHPKIGRVKATSPTGHGIGYHTMWGAPSAWTPVAKTCPGRARIAQFPALLLMIQSDIELGDLSVADIKAIMDKLDEHDKAFEWLAELVGPMYQDIHGTDLPELGDKNPRHRSLMTGVTGIRNELVSGSDKDPNSRLSILRRIYDQNRAPDKTV